MARILLVYGTTEGQTRKIAERIAAVLEHLGHAPELRDSATIAESLSPGAFDAVMIGASVHRGRHQSAVRRFVSANLGVLEQVPTAFFSVSLVASSADAEDRKDAENLIEAFCEKAGWRPSVTRTVAGALRYTQYGFLKRWLLKLIMRREGGPTDSSRDHELTDWEDVERFARQFAGLCAARPASPADDGAAAR